MSKARPNKIKSKHYLEIFQLARQGLGKVKMAKELRVSKQSLVRWLKEDREAKRAYAAGRAEFRGASFTEYAYNHLPPDLQKVWDEMVGMNEAGEIVRAHSWSNLTKRDKQYLFVHALIANNFNATKASEMTGISYSSWNTWQREDHKFMEMVKQIHQMKKDFVEGALMGLISQGDSAAVIFANKTLNADRGYRVEKKVEVSGSVDHKHQISIDDVLDALPIAQRKIALERIKQLGEGKKMLPAHGKADEDMLIQDAQYTVKEEVTDDET